MTTQQQTSSPFPYGDPQEGMVEHFNEAMARVGELLPLALETAGKLLAGAEDPTQQEQLRKGLASLWLAKSLWDLLQKPGHPPFDVGGVHYMLGIGMTLQESKFPPEMSQAIADILQCWRQGVTEWPMPHRYAPAVAWAISGENPGLFIQRPRT